MVCHMGLIKLVGICAATMLFVPAATSAQAHVDTSTVQTILSRAHANRWYIRTTLSDRTTTEGIIAEAPDKEAAIAVHRESHGLVAEELTEVKEGS